MGRRSEALPAACGTAAGHHAVEYQAHLARSADSFLLRLHLGQIDALNAAIAELDREVEASIEPFRTAVEQVSTIPGVKDLSARTILSEIGINMGQFPSDANLISWALHMPA